MGNIKDFDFYVKSNGNLLEGFSKDLFVKFFLFLFKYVCLIYVLELEL